MSTHNQNGSSEVLLVRKSDPCRNHLNGAKPTGNKTGQSHQSNVCL